MIKVRAQSYPTLCEKGLQNDPYFADGNCDRPTVVIMAAALVCTPNKGVEQEQANEWTDVSSGNSAGGQVDVEGSNSNQAENQAASSSAHTDSENADENENLEKNRAKKDKHKEKEHPSADEILSDKDPRRVQNRAGTPLPQPHSSRSRSPGRSQQGSGRNCRSSSEDSDGDSYRNYKRNKSSFVEYKLGRKNLLKIERLTDSDNRSRRTMRKRALSPPSSSDDENLYIGWVAYPAVASKGDNGRRQSAMCACVEAIKCVLYPVTRVCQVCRKNKVGDVSLLPKSKKASRESQQLPTAQLYNPLL